MRRFLRSTVSLSAASTSPSYLAGHRAMLVGPMRATDASLPPLVLLGGTAQWLDSWTGHLTALAAKRRVLLYETRGQGCAFAQQGSSQLDVMDCGLDTHADDFWRVVEAADLMPSIERPLDCVGFSFGGRVAMAAAQRGNIRRLCVTGVSADRGPRGRLALASWRASLAAGDLSGFAWKLILDTYATSTLSAREDQVASWVASVTAANTVDGLRAIIDQTHTEDPADATHPLAMARAIQSQGAVESGLLLCGEEDMLSSTDEGAAQALADAAGWDYQAIARAAHAAPIEQPVAWRKAVLNFLDTP